MLRSVIYLLHKYSWFGNFILHDENSTFLPKIWAENSRDIQRTINARESFHGRFNNSYFTSPPSIFIFLDI